MTPHERDRVFLAWVRTATRRELSAALRKAKHRWQWVAIARAAARLEVRTMQLSAMLGPEDGPAPVALGSARERSKRDG